MPSALITGANRGLGLETAKQLAAKGWEVILAVRDRAKGEEAGVPGARVVELDLAKPATAAALAAQLDRIDVLVNNAAISMRGFRAGFARGKPSSDMGASAPGARVAEKTIAINLLGTLAVTEALAPRVTGAIVMVSSGMGELSGLRDPARGKVARASTLSDVRQLGVAFVSSVAAGRHRAEGWPESAYSVSKALLNAATRVLATDLAPIRVNAVCPGWVRTDLGGRNAPRDVATGARSIVAAVLEPRATGGFFRDGRPIDW